MRLIKFKNLASKQNRRDNKSISKAKKHKKQESPENEKLIKSNPTVHIKEKVSYKRNGISELHVNQSNEKYEHEEKKL